MDLLMESAVKLHKPDAGFDVDLTLNRGRIYLSSHRRQAPSRCVSASPTRFGTDVAGTDTEVGVDLLKIYMPNINYRDGEKPLEALYLAVLTGKAGVVVESQRVSRTWRPPVAVLLERYKGTGHAGADPPAAAGGMGQMGPSRRRPARARARRTLSPRCEALDKVSLNMTDKKAVETAPAGVPQRRQLDDVDARPGRLLFRGRGRRGPASGRAL